MKKLIALWIICVLVFSIGIALLASSIIHTIDKHGLKSVVERVWEGDKKP